MPQAPFSVKCLPNPFLTVQIWGGCSQPTRSSAVRLAGLLAVNGLGGLIGAEFTLRCLLPILGIYGGFVFVAASFVIICWLNIFAMPRPWNVYRHVLAAAALLLIVTIGWKYVVNMPTTNLRSGMTLVDSAVGFEGVVAVVQDNRGDRSIIMSNQYSLGGTSVRYDQERQLLLPLLLHPAPKHVACIGLATGITAGAALALPEIESVTAVELSPLVVEAAERDFAQYNNHFTTSPKARIVVEDGRTYIASCVNQFDVISGDLFLPWAPGESRLYSLEHFQAVRHSLKPDGVFCQWLAMHQLTREQMESIAATFQQVFPDTVLFIDHFRGDSAMLALVGWNSPIGTDVPWDTVQHRCDTLRANGEITDPILRSVEGLMMLYLGRWENELPPKLVTLDDPSLEISAASERLSGNPARKYFSRVKWIEFCREHRSAAVKQSDPFVVQHANLLELAGGLQEFDFALISRNKIATAIAQQLHTLMPLIIRDDATADWSRWPGSSSAWREAR